MLLALLAVQFGGKDTGDESVQINGSGKVNLTRNSSCQSIRMFHLFKNMD
jgi:hypothetical protein